MRVFPESRQWCECGSTGLNEWSCEGGLKPGLEWWGVDADGSPVRYQRGAHDSVQNERMIYFINLGGTAEATGFCPLWG